MKITLEIDERRITELERFLFLCGSEVQVIHDGQHRRYAVPHSLFYPITTSADFDVNVNVEYIDVLRCEVKITEQVLKQINHLASFEFRPENYM